MAENRKKLLIADDEFNTREVLCRYFRNRFDVTPAADGTEAIEQLKKNRFDLVLTDLRMPGADGFSVLDACCAKAERTPCILLTAYGQIEDAVQAVKKGAFDFVPKPVDLNRLEEVMKQALEPAAPPRKTVVPAAGSGTVPVGPSGADDPMTRVFATAKTVAPTRSTVLLSGESGTGKEVLARYIHDHSKRTGLFVPVHCAALTATLLESELFGYEKGAFTGAAERRKGRFELADGGTIFLDEIGEIDLATQVKLLRVLETRAFERVGGTETIQSDVRLIAATNRDLRKMVQEQTFREDLFYRLSVVNLELPPLRERRGEIPVLAKNFVREFAAENSKPALPVSAEAMEILKNYNWPGNIRELRNCMEYMVVLAPGPELTPADLPESLKKPPLPQNTQEKPAEPSLNMEDSERELIARALEKCGGNRSAAAKMLGISRRTLYRKLDAENHK